MTQQVRKGYRNHRKGTWAAVLVVLAAAALAIALPALADNTSTCTDASVAPGCIPPKTATAEVYPSQVDIGGSNFSCTRAPVNGAPSNPYVQFQLSKPDPKGGPNGDGKFTDSTTGVQFQISPPSSSAIAGKFFSFSVVGAKVYHVGVNGGTNTAWYDYATNTGSTGFVRSDTDLHATKQSATKFYVASITTFCYLLEVTTIKGQVFEDKDQSGTYTTGTPSDTPKAWSVSLLRKVNGVFQPYKTTTSDPAISSNELPNYTFTDVPVGGNYKVCVSAAAPDTSKAWALKTPTGAAICPAISATSDASAGILIEPLAGPATGQNFAAVAVTAPIACGGDSSVTDYKVKLGNGPGATTSENNCTKPTSRYVQGSFTDGTATYFNFTPSPGTTSTGRIRLVEELKSTFPLSKGQDSVLKYDDVAPYDTFVNMPFCKTDPRVSPATDKLTLKSNLDESAVLPGTDTSCLIETSEIVVPAGISRLDYVFSAFDGGRQVT